MMNERIKEFAAQCRTIVDYGMGKYETFDDEKFAKLIVQECLKQGANVANEYIDTHSEQEQVMLLSAIADYSSEIKKHFGVE